MLFRSMSRWAKHDGALAQISLQRLVEMLSLQCAQRFPARPADPQDRHGAEAPAAPGDQFAKSPLQRTLTAHIMSRWTKYEGLLVL